MYKRQDVRDLMSGAKARDAVLGKGQMDDGIWTSGQSQALIHEIPTCKELVSQIMAEAESIINSRLAGMVRTH